MPVSQVSFGGSEISDSHMLLSNWYRFHIKMVHLLQVNRKLLNENVQLLKAPALRLDHPLSGKCIRTLRVQPQINNKPGRLKKNNNKMQDAGPSASAYVYSPKCILLPDSLRVKGNSHLKCNI